MTVHDSGGDFPGDWHSGFPRNRHHRAFSDGLDDLMEIFQKRQQRFRFLRQKHGRPQPIASQAQQIQDAAGIFDVSFGNRRTTAIAAGAGFAADQSNAVRSHLECPEKQRLAHTAGAGNPDHAHIGRQVGAAVLKRMISGMRAPVADKQNDFQIVHHYLMIEV